MRKRKTVAKLIEEEMEWINGWAVSEDRFKRLCENTAKKVERLVELIERKRSKC